jgi:hypothetical protein
MDFARFVAQALVIGVIGPLFWLGVNVLEGWLQRRGFPLAGFDLFSRQCWKQAFLKLRPRSGQGEAAAPKRLR